MYRVVLEEPLSRAAAWSRSLALFALAVALIGIIMARAGLDATAAMAVEGGAIGTALLAIAAAGVAAVVIWRTGYRGIDRLLAGLVLAALVIAYPAGMALRAGRMPSLRDVSTNPGDPPRFAASSQALAARGGMTPRSATGAEQDLQRRIYPDLQPIVLDMEAADAHRVVEKLLAARRWRIVDNERPLGTGGAGRIDAVAKTLVMGFPADVTIRIRPTGSQSTVDIRSASRTPWQEPGSNAARVRAFATDLDEQVSDDK